MHADGGPARHARVWIRPDRLRAVRAAEPAHDADVARWIALGRPAVARRRDAGMAPDDVALAIALPAEQGRSRIALAAPASAIARVAPPLRLAEALASAPPEWAGPLSGLVAEAGAAGVVLRVYGSLAWQHLTGEAYLRPGSDVDLIAPGGTGAERARSLALLRPWEAHACPRLDGELDLGEGRAAAWRELLSRAARVLVKGSDSVSLEPLATVLGACEGGAA